MKSRSENRDFVVSIQDMLWGESRDDACPKE
jgi:hypothetical protein